MRKLKIENRLTLRNRTIDLYFNELNRRDRISADEEIDLAEKIKKGDEEALRKLIEANLRFVVSVAKQYTQEKELLADLISQGNIGLIEAAKKYDHTMGFKFISYAVWFIRKEILIYYETLHKAIKMPRSAEQDMRIIKKAEEKLEAQLGRVPTPEEILFSLAESGEKFSLERVEKLRVEERKILPLDSKEEDEWSPLHWLAKEDSTVQRLDRPNTKKLVEELLYCLNPIEREIVERVMGLNGGEPVKFVTINENHNKSRSWSQAIYKVALRKLRARHNRLTRKSV